MIKNWPLISVVIPTCDRGSSLCNAVASVKSQTYTPVECIIVDNGIEPANYYLTQGGHIEQVSVVEMAPRVGPSAARNRGADVACGDYVAFLDDDDTWRPDYLLKVTEKLWESKALVVLGALSFSSRKLHSNDYPTIRCIDSSSTGLRKLFYCNPGFSGQNLTISKHVLQEIGGFDEDMFCSEDRDLGVRLLLEGVDIQSQPQAVVDVKRGGGMGKHAGKGNIQFLRKHWRRMSYGEIVLAFIRLVKIFALRLRPV